MAHTDNTDANEILLTGLRNAHAMEKQALSIIDPQLKRIESYPDVLQRLQQHRSETEHQIERLEGILDQLGDSPSVVKDTVLSMMGGLASLGHAPAGDEILKQSFANFAFENYEIAAYNSLIQLAEASGQTEIVAPLRENLEEEERMAKWLEQHLPDVTQQYVVLRRSGEKAKH